MSDAPIDYSPVLTEKQAADIRACYSNEAQETLPQNTTPHATIATLRAALDQAKAEKVEAKYWWDKIRADNDALRAELAAMHLERDIALNTFKREFDRAESANAELARLTANAEQRQLALEQKNAEVAAVREALEQIVRKDKRYEENCTSQDTGYDGPYAKIARAALQSHRRTET